MRILLTKLNDDRHALEIERVDHQRERVELETRSCLLHDLTHFAVEQAAGIDQGFFGALAAGRTLAELNGRAGESVREYAGVMLQVERTVAVLQAMAKTKEEPTAAHRRITAMLAVQGEVPPTWFTVELVTKVHERMRRLLGQWKATPYGTAMELVWTATAMRT
jgi:hypothetical protein